MKINRSETRPPSGLGNTAGALPASKSGGGTGPEALPLAADRVQLSNLSASLTAATGDSAAHLEKLSALAAVVSDSIIRHSLQFGGAKYL
jgi:hypothetical protein